MPNITRTTHADCARLSFTPGATWFGLPGDVKRCPHGKLMVRTQTGPNSRMMGPGTDWWRTLSPVWNPIEYRRAKAALASSPRQAAPRSTVPPVSRPVTRKSGWL